MADPWAAARAAKKAHMMVDLSVEAKAVLTAGCWAARSAVASVEAKADWTAAKMAV